MTVDQHKDLEKLMEDFCKRMTAYGCDSVQVLASVTDAKEATTQAKRRGLGNWYARKGMAQEFIDEDRTRTEEHIKENEFNDSEGSDDWKDA